MILGKDWETCSHSVDILKAELTEFVGGLDIGYGFWLEDWSFHLLKWESCRISRFLGGNNFSLGHVKVAFQVAILSRQLGTHESAVHDRGLGWRYKFPVLGIEILEWVKLVWGVSVAGEV